jgi:hypothetical protein
MYYRPWADELAEAQAAAERRREVADRQEREMQEMEAMATDPEEMHEERQRLEAEAQAERSEQHALDEDFQWKIMVLGCCTAAHLYTISPLSHRAYLLSVVVLGVMAGHHLAAVHRASAWLFYVIRQAALRYMSAKPARGDAHPAKPSQPIVLRMLASVPDDYADLKSSLVESYSWLQAHGPEFAIPVLLFGGLLITRIFS